MNHIISSKNTLVYDIYIKSRETNPWVKKVQIFLKVKIFLNGLGHSYILNNINSIKLNLNTIKQRIHDQCLQAQNANICDSQKLPYVDVLNNRCDRAAICKIHISAHPLMIERGRHLNIPRTERYCLLCKSNQIEDEKHFLLHCKKFNTQRNIFNEKISNILENASYKNANNKISFLFNNKSYSILRLTSSFISNCLNIRKDLLLFL